MKRILIIATCFCFLYSGGSIVCQAQTKTTAPSVQKPKAKVAGKKVMKTAVANPAVKTAAPAAEAPVAQKKVVASKAHKGVWKPEYPGGIKALSDYIDNNLIWPAPDVAGDTQGTVIIRLFFDETGRITMANIVKSLAPAFDAAAFHLTLDMPNWLPGKEDGKPVASSIDLPVVFEHK